MADRQRYRRKPDQAVAAVQLRLETEGFHYEKWGHTQSCKAGDWIVDNQGDVYTIDDAVFASTYRELRPGAFVKITPIWAEIAQEDGSVKTKEGATQYVKGGYLVSNNEDGSDAYAISKEKFCGMYELDE